MTTTTLTDKQRELIQGLRDMADFLEANPSFRTNTTPRLYMRVYDRYEFVELVRALGPAAAAQIDDEDIEAVATFGPCSVMVFGPASAICEPVTTTETVTATTWKIPDELAGE